MPVDFDVLIDESTDELIIPYEETSDPSIRTHIVNPADNIEVQLTYGRVADAQELVNLARAIGVEIIALCGHKFVPKHNPDKPDACEACMKIAGEIMASQGE